MRLLLPTTILAFTLFLSGCLFVSKTPVKPAPSNIAATSTAKIDTTDWKTYTNDEYGFSFRYPREWRVTALPGRGTSILAISVAGQDPKCNKAACNELYSEASLDMTITTTSLDTFLTAKRESLSESLRPYVSASSADYLRIQKPLHGISGGTVTDIGLKDVFYYFTLYDNINLYVTYFDTNEEVMLSIVNTIKLIR